MRAPEWSVVCLVGLLATRPVEAHDLASGLQWASTWRQVPSHGGFTQDSTARFVFTSVRVRPLAPFQAPWPDAVSGPFVEVNATTIREGRVNRVTIDNFVGYVFPLVPAVGVGPMVGYSRALRADDLWAAPADSDFLTVGVNVVVGRR